MRQILALACIAAGLAVVTPAAAAYDNCTSYLIGGWTLETDGDPVTVVFGGGGHLKMVRREGEEWAKWTATDGAGMKTCDVSIVSGDGHDEHITFDILDERTIRAKNKTYRREGTATEQAYEDNDKVDQSFDRSTCPTYFVGSWTAQKGGTLARTVFREDGTFTSSEGRVGKPLSTDDDLQGTWRAKAGAAKGWCGIFVAIGDGKEEYTELMIVGQDKFRDFDAKRTFHRE